MALTSPGVEVSVINESFYVPSDAGTTPLFIVASSQDKNNGAGDGTAAGTQTANANTAYLISSQRELTETFGDPKFYTDASGNPLHGYELNEYGLQAAYSFLGIANRAYVLRANVDLGALESSSTAPTNAPADGSYWLDTSATSFGLYEYVGSAWVKKDIKQVSASDIDSDGVSPKQAFGVNGDYAVVYVTSAGGTQPIISFFQKLSGVWYNIGASAVTSIARTVRIITI